MNDSNARIPIVQIDAFTSRPLKGNPAAVMVLDHWLPDDTLQAVAAENNLAETAYLTRDGADFQLRWFTPTIEIDLCGHATLASGHHVLNSLEPGRSSVTFMTKSGALTVRRHTDRLVMDFPAIPLTEPRLEDWSAVSDAIGQEITDLRRGWAYMAVLASEGAVKDFKPNMSAIERLPLNLILTAPGTDSDFVSRFFAPKFGIPEDPVTGRSHCSLGPYWGEKLGKRAMFARQYSARGGEIWLELADHRVLLSGHCVEVLRGTMHLPN